MLENGPMKLLEVQKAQGEKLESIENLIENGFERLAYVMDKGFSQQHLDMREMRENLRDALKEIREVLNRSMWRVIITLCVALLMVLSWATAMKTGILPSLTDTQHGLTPSVESLK